MSFQTIELSTFISSTTTEFKMPNLFKDSDDYKLKSSDIDCIFDVYKIGYTRGFIKRLEKNYQK